MLYFDVINYLCGKIWNYTDGVQMLYFLSFKTLLSFKSFVSPVRLLARLKGAFIYFSCNFFLPLYFHKTCSKRSADMFLILVWIVTITDGENALHTAEKQFPPLSHKHLMCTCPWQSRFGSQLPTFSTFILKTNHIKIIYIYKRSLWHCRIEIPGCTMNEWQGYEQL